MFRPCDPVTVPRQPWVLPAGHWVHQAYSWLVFLLLLGTAWVVVLRKAMAKLAEDTDQQVRAGDALRRTYLLALCALTGAQVWISVVYGAVVVYVAMSIVFIVMSFLPTAHLPGAAPLVNQLLTAGRMNLQRMLDPRVALGWLHAHHMAAHGFVLLVLVCLPVVPILLYIHNDDLRDAYTTRAKVMRVLFVLPLLWALCYTVYAALCVGRAFGL